ncbi:hypothetical protein ACLOJK_012263 [Asimina triloba]
MEGEKKKKKSKKKNSKQSKTTEGVAVANGATVYEHEHVQSSNSTGVQNTVVSESDVDANSHKNEDLRSTDSTALLEEDVRRLEGEKQNWLQREVASLLSSLFTVLLFEQHFLVWASVKLEEKIRLLEDEKDSCVQKEVDLEKTIRNLQDEKGSWLRKEASFEEKLKELQSEKSSWILKKLAEKIVNSYTDMIARLEEVNVGLQAQVKESEESRNSLLQENQQLLESATFLEARIQHLEREVSYSASSGTDIPKEVPKNEDENSLVEAACALVEKLVAENAELVEKVNELHLELDRHSLHVSHASTAGLHPTLMTSESTVAPDSLSPYDDKMVVSIERPESHESIQTVDHQNVFIHADLEPTAGSRAKQEELPQPYGISEVSEISEISEIPLEENEIQEEIEVDTIPKAVGGEDDAVPLTDAPLIGAPFRLVSFMAKYVSGADLVNKNSSAG